MNDPDRRHTSDGFDHDAMFADIVAHWSEVAAEPRPKLAPASHDESAHGEAPDDQATDDQSPDVDVAGDDVPEQPQVGHVHFQDDPPTAQPPPSEPYVIPAPQAWRAHDPDDDYEDHFEPPPIAPLPAGDLQFWGIIAGMCGGPLLLLYLVLFNRDAGSSWMLTSIALSIGGFALLISRLPRDHQDDDDGARL